MGKRLTAWLLSLALAVTLLPGLELTALAAEAGSAAGPPAVETADGLPAPDAPAEPPDTDAPAEPPVTDAPAESPVTDAPAEPPVTEEPAEPPVTDEPAEPPVTDEPAEPPVTEEPAELPITAEPAALPSPSLVQAAAGQEDSYVEIYRFFTEQNDWTDWTGTTLRDGYYIKSNQNYNSEGKYPTYQANPGQFPDQYVLFFRDGVLYMNGYEGGPIGVTNAPDAGLEIQVIGNSYITVPSFVWHTSALFYPQFYSCIIMATKSDYPGTRTLTITSDTGKTLSLSGSTNSDSDHRKSSFLYGVYGGTLGRTNVRLMGDVTVDINLNHIKTCGILANALEILDRASLNITQSADDCCFGPNVSTDTEMCYAVGIDAKTLTVKTAGSIKMDLSKVRSGYSYLYSRGLRLTEFHGDQIPYMSIKWRPGGRNLGGPLYDRDDAAMNPPSNLVVQRQSDRSIYRTGTRVEFDLEGCEVRLARDSAGRELLTYDPFVEGDKLQIIQTRVPELPILYWQIGDYYMAEGQSLFQYEVDAHFDGDTIKPVFRLGESSKPVFEWLNQSGGIVRYQMDSVEGLRDFKLWQSGTNQPIAKANSVSASSTDSPWKYDPVNKELTVAVESISPGSYRLTAVKGSTLSPPELYTAWFAVHSVDEPEVTTKDGCYYRSIKLEVNVPEDGKSYDGKHYSGTLYYKPEWNATITEWDRGTNYSESPMILDGGHSDPTCWTMRVRWADDYGNVIWSVPKNVDTIVWELWEDTILGTGDPPPPVMSVKPEANYKRDLSSGEYILTGPVKAELHWSLPPSQWPINARMRYTTDPNETDKSNYKYYDGNPISFDDQSGGYLKIVTSARDAYGVLHYSDVGTYKFIPGEPSSGVTVSGTVTSYGSGDVTIQLIADGQSEPAYEATAPAGPQSGNAYTASYSIPNVPAGTYTLKVMKQNHVTREYTVTVGAENVTQDVKIHLKGDINGDGKITTVDAMRANSHARGVTLLTGYELKCADVVGTDGKITTADAMRINAHARKTALLW